MAKKMRFARKAARMARSIPTTPPQPQDTTAAAAAGIDINRGSSTAQPLSPLGAIEADQTGAALAAKGGLDSLTTSTAARAEQTSQHIAAQSPRPLQVQEDPQLESWAQGGMEGQPQKLVKDQIRDLVRNNPTYKIPGQGALSNRRGESFNDFRTRGISAIRGAMQELANNPHAKIGRTTHSQVIKLTKGWLKAGTPDDMSVDPSEMDDASEAPGAVSRLYPNEKGEWELNDVNLADSKPLDPGVYLIRHGLTDWNSEAQKANVQTDVRSQLAKYIKSGEPANLGRAKALGIKSGMSEDDLSDATDAALPSAEEAADLPMHHILAVAAAASPAKKAQYAPLIQKYFGDLSSLPPDARAQLQQHINQIMA